MNYIPKTALKDITEKMKDGYDLGLALFSVSIHYAIDRQELREAYDRKLKRDELLFIASNALLALGMVSAFLCPVFFYLVARG